MKFHSPMIIVADMEKSKQFYVNILREEISMDLGNYVALSSGLSLMTQQQWNTLTGDTCPSVGERGHNFELYFEEDDLDAFVRQLDKATDIIKFTPLEEAPWAQRTVRFLDPDNYVIEVSESMETTVKRLLSAGMTVEEASGKSMMPIAFVQKCAAQCGSTD